MGLEQRFSRLKEIIFKNGSCLIAFSGGLDSAFLLKAASLVLPKEKILALTANSLFYPQEELLFARKFTRQLGLRHKIIKFSHLKDKKIAANTLKRCYFCKKKIFLKFKHIAKRYRLNSVLEASSLSDKDDFRPGFQALKELRISSPLIEAGLTKQEIRLLSKQLGLLSWNKPSSACLASRIPYGNRISLRVLKRIEQAEKFIRSLGFKQVRVRDYGWLARIEVEKDQIKKIVTCYRLQAAGYLKKLGYKYVVLDLEGYRTGSMNNDAGKNT
jgi:uncharacterized protein